ncbi:MAG: S26 family signal peptidase [Spirochaetaceae bacterium]|jgi:signal peptidase I|nr:S26 family signal peptidase [Spirochaetaceae bacterium]
MNTKKKSVALAILLAFFAAAVMKLFCFDFIIVEGESMFPVIHNGTLLFVNRLAYGFRPPFSNKYLVRWALPEKGDAVLFYTPLGDLAVKRSAGFFKGKSNSIYWTALGDNSTASFDSRSYGPVSVDSIIGKAVGY